MIQLSEDNVELATPARSKEEAIRAAGRVLVAGGYIEPGYVESMLRRELQANTYLGSGIAIPHGLGEDRALIRRTGVAVVQLANGVDWGEGQAVRLVVGIAAKSDQHLGVLAALTDVLDDPELAAQLARTDSASRIVAALSRRGQAVPPVPEEGLVGASHVDVKLPGDAGLHARPATAFVELAARFEAEIRVQHGGRIANGKAFASVLKLGVGGGETIRILASGADADAALATLRAAVEGGLGEAVGAEAREDVELWTPLSHGRELTGMPASPGIAIGPVYQYQETRVNVTDAPAADPQLEQRRLEQALETAREQLADLYDSLRKRAGAAEAAIFRAHQALLRDPDLAAEVRLRIERGENAGWAWQRAIEERVAELRQVADERLAGRAADLHDVGQRVLRVLTGVEHGEPHLPAEPVILIADDLAPSDTARLDPQRILGLVTAGGGPTSHTAIIARSLDIPAVVGAGPSALELVTGTLSILDGVTGRFYVEPSAADVESARNFQGDLSKRRVRDSQERFDPAFLRDGHRVEVVANIGRTAEAEQAIEAGAEGVGLMRTEFLFLERDTPPTEEEHFEAYRIMARALDGLPLVIRTLDIGGDKAVPYLALPPEENPFLGVRGIRLCLRKPELFVPQLRAIYRAAQTGVIKVMFPMIATLDELRAARGMAEEVRQELGAPPIEVGIMIEVPSAVTMAAELAVEADFFSVGTNDLAQYALAIDRMHPTLAAQLDGLHPAILRMIDHTVRAADAAGKWVAVCGGIAGDPLGALILTGLGVRELSMSIPSIPGVKAALRRYSSAQARDFAQRALACSSAGEVRRLPLP
jgi:multiphosphoryl transfer protein